MVAITMSLALQKEASLEKLVTLHFRFLYFSTVMTVTSSNVDFRASAPILFGKESNSRLKLKKYTNTGKAYTFILNVFLTR